MDIVADIMEAIKKGEGNEDCDFQKQIRDAERFLKEMINAGVPPQKKTFTIPLMDRIYSYPAD